MKLSFLGGSHRFSKMFNSFSCAEHLNFVTSKFNEARVTVILS